MERLAIMGRWFHPETWAGWMPNGIGQVKPNHFFEMFRTVWENRDEIPYAWRILNEGVCDGCALGTSGLNDFTMSGKHLCTVRLNLLRLNTMGAMNESLLEDCAALEKLSSKELRDLGRLPYPMLRRKGEKGYRRISWDEAYDTIADKIRATDPKRLAFYLTSRGITNEVYYVAQKAARYLGTNNVDNAARICHSPSTVALKATLGVAASTCSYKDWIGADLIVFLGSNTPNNQPVTTKYLYYAKTQGTKIAVVNPLKEPGLERYWVPSVFESALFGTKLADEWYAVHTGGDLAFLNGVLKALIEMDALDHAFLREHTEGFEAVKEKLAAQTWEELEKFSGAPRTEIKRFAEMYARAKSAIFVWSMGITQHANGVDNVKAIVNLALARGMLGKEHCGLMPIRGHSGVQGGGEVGCVPNTFPGGDAVNEANAEKFSRLWGFEVPKEKGLLATDMIHASHRGEIDVFYSAGGNFLETLPEPEYVREALAKIPLRVHQDILVTSQMLVEPAETSVLLPARTRYEQEDGGTETTTERQIIFSPEIPGRRIGEARSEWRIFMEVAERARPERRQRMHFSNGQDVRDEIARAVPSYAGIEQLRKKGDHVQWGGRSLCPGGQTPLPGGKARFSALEPLEKNLADGQFMLSTRRGKQFNSIVHQKRDPLTGADRDAILMNAEDAGKLGLAEGDAVVVRSEIGAYRGLVKFAPIKPRNVQGHWPEVNGLLRRGACEPQSGVPDYNALVTISKDPS
ncbi:MAG: FdhF/YdeP family oxidoreductase [Planctomycetota bacterium]|nr:FdhF/YdeP family oxidoreductase [Planctomycetota bacterium]